VDGPVHNYRQMLLQANCSIPSYLVTTAQHYSMEQHHCPHCAGSKSGIICLTPLEGKAHKIRILYRSEKPVMAREGVKASYFDRTDE
jgi:hypothetical protein